MSQSQHDTNSHSSTHAHQHGTRTHTSAHATLDADAMRPCLHEVSNSNSHNGTCMGQVHVICYGMCCRCLDEHVIVTCHICDVHDQVWHCFHVLDLVCMAAVSRHWARHLSSSPPDSDTETDTDTHTHTATSSASPRARRHLSLHRRFVWDERVKSLLQTDDATVRVRGVHSFHALLAQLAGVQEAQIHVRISKSVRQVRRPTPISVPVTLLHTWLSRCTRLRKLEWRDESQPAEQPATQRQMQHMQHTQHALSHLAPALTELRMHVNPVWWEAGAYACVMAALPPLSCLHIQRMYESLASDQLLPTWRALTQRHAATLHTLHMQTHAWSWATWGQLGELTHVTELDVSHARLPAELDATDQEYVTAVSEMRPCTQLRNVVACSMTSCAVVSCLASSCFSLPPLCPAVSSPCVASSALVSRCLPRFSRCCSSSCACRDVASSPLVALPHTHRSVAGSLVLSR